MARRIRPTISEEPVVTPVIEEPVVESKPSEKVVSTECLNIRKEPNGEVIKQLYRNTVVKVDSVNNGWAKISSPIAGYCKEDFLA